MGLFDFLLGSKSASRVELASDHIWISQQAKFIGVQKELEERLGSDSVAVLLIAHFDDTLVQLKAIAAAYGADTRVTATLAGKLSLDIAVRLNLDETRAIDLIVAERHPLFSVDKKLIRFAEELPCRCRVAHHLSMDDPLLKMFAGARLQNILEKLGMTENEPIESSMVSRRIKDAQKNIEAQAFADSEAGTAAEWIEKNMLNTSQD